MALVGDISIRRLEVEDLASFKHLRLEALRLEPEAFASSLADAERLSDAEWAARLTENAVFGAFAADDLIGMMALIPSPFRKMAHRATIGMVYLAAPARGGGVASALLQSLTAHARAESVRQLELMCSSENAAAISFYRREGFSEMGRIPGGYVHEGREIDDLLMYRRIDR
ncbi:MAG: GNAT family N-acetyltransferase [Pseudomonadota bacterium]